MEIGTEALNEWLAEKERESKMAEEERGEAINVIDLEGGNWFSISKKFMEKFAPITGTGGVAVYCALKYFANTKDRKAFPSITRIALMLSCTRDTVIEYLEKLENAKAIKVERKPGRVNTYYLPKLE